MDTLPYNDYTNEYEAKRPRNNELRPPLPPAGKDEIFIGEKRGADDDEVSNEIKKQKSDLKMEIVEPEEKPEELEFDERNSLFLADLGKMNLVQDYEDRKDILETIQSGLNSTKYDNDPFVFLYRPQVSELVDNAYNEMWANPDNSQRIIYQIKQKVNSLRTQSIAQDEMINEDEPVVPYEYTDYNFGTLSPEEKENLPKVIDFINSVEKQIQEHNIFGPDNIFDKAMTLLKRYGLECDQSLQIIDDNTLAHLQYYAPFITNNDEFYKMVYLKQIQPNKDAMELDNNETIVSVSKVECGKLQEEFKTYFNECNLAVNIILTQLTAFRKQFSTINQYAKTLARIHPNKPLIKLLADVEEYIYSGRVFNGINKVPYNDAINLITKLIIGSDKLNELLNDNNNLNQYKRFVALQKLCKNNFDKNKLTKINNRFDTSFNTVTAVKRYVKEELNTFYNGLLLSMSESQTKDDPYNAVIIKNFKPSNSVDPFFIHFKLWFLKNYAQSKKKELTRLASMKENVSELRKIYTKLETIIQTFRSVSDGITGYQNAIDELIIASNKTLDYSVKQIVDILSVGQQQETLQNKLQKIQQQLKYPEFGRVLDFADLSHDIAVYKPLLIDNPKEDLFTAKDQAVQHKLRKKREEVLSDIVKICKEQNVALPDLSDKVLTKMQTQAYFYKFLLANPTGSWLYKESGRRPDLFAFLKYYESLNEDDKDAFTNMCMDYASETPDNTKFDDIISGITENLVSKDKKDKKDVNQNDKSIYIPLLCISGFDGGGNVMDNASPSFAVFEYVYGVYKYSVWSGWKNGANKRDTNDIGHLVMVTLQSNQQILAIFCFVGKVTLNSLIDYANKTWKGLCIPRRGGGEDEGGGNAQPWIGKVESFCKTYDIESGLKEKGLDFAGNLSPYFEGTLKDEEKQLLFFLNKTIGDKIFSVYPSYLKVITTVDSLVPQSVLLHGLSGKIDCIQEVWRKGRGGSTTVSPGVFGVNYEVIATSVLYKMVCYGFVCKYIQNEKYTEVLNEYIRPLSSGNPFNDPIIGESLSLLGSRFACPNLHTAIENYIGVNIANNELMRISNAVDFLFTSYPPEEVRTLYDRCMTYLSDKEHELMRTRLLANLDQLLRNIPQSGTLEAININNIYSLPDLEQLFAFNMDAQGTANQTYVDFYEIDSAFPSSIPKNTFFTNFSGLNPDIKSEPFTKPTDNNTRTYITMGEEKITFWFFIPSTIESHEDSKRFNAIVVEELTGVKTVVESSSPIKDNKQRKMALYRIDVEITIELLMQVFEQIREQPGEKLIPLKSAIATMIIEFFDEQKEELITKYKKDVQYPNELERELNTIKSAIIVKSDEECIIPKGGKRASTRGKKVVKKKHTKRDRKRVAHKKQTKKLRRKKHRTVNKRRARK